MIDEVTVLIEPQVTEINVELSDVGIRGPQGLIGDQGPEGDKGETGDKGPGGDMGPKGDKGDTGEQGPIGLTGEKGDTGEAGPKGDKGDTGNQGSIGVTGAKGDTGTQGPKGDKGDTGSQGPIGVTGAKGDTGEAGAQGLAGPSGAKGDKGDTGDDGDVGPAGPAGAAGPKGDTGDTGAAGAAGPKGDKGDTGSTGPAGAAGAVGPQGPVGADGEDGAPGQAGPQGPQGVPGSAGAKGDTGAAGQNGSDGAQGPQGVKGDTGAAGAQGPQGAAGINWKDAWSSLASYIQNDGVSFNGSSYRALTAIAPTATDPEASLAANTTGNVGSITASNYDTRFNSQHRQAFTTNASRYISSIDVRITSGQPVTHTLTVREQSTGNVIATATRSATAGGSYNTWTFTPFTLPAGNYFLDISAPSGVNPSIGNPATVAGAVSASTAYLYGDTYPATNVYGGSWRMLFQLNGSSTAPAWAAIATKGATGVAGATGPAGPTGATGPTGDTGAQGPQGVKGDTGATGPAGSGGTSALVEWIDPFDSTTMLDQYSFRSSLRSDVELNAGALRIASTAGTLVSPKLTPPLVDLVDSEQIVEFVVGTALGGVNDTVNLNARRMDDTYIQAQFVAAGGFRISKVVDGVSTSIGALNIGVVPSGNRYWMRLVVSGERAEAALYSSDPDGENVTPVNLNGLVTLTYNFDAGQYPSSLTAGASGKNELQLNVNDQSYRIERYVVRSLAPAGPAGAAGTMPASSSKTAAAAALANGATATGTIDLGKGFRISKMVGLKACRVRLYVSDAKRTADASRARTADPVGNHGCIAEVFLTDTVLDLDLLPQPIGSVTGLVYYSITNDGTTGDASVTITSQTLEV